jgi:hypothetical protein
MDKGTVRKIENGYLLKEPLLDATVGTFNTRRAMYRRNSKGRINNAIVVVSTTSVSYLATILNILSSSIETI